jgi:hypothetical protein
LTIGDDRRERVHRKGITLGFEVRNLLDERRRT